MQGWENNDLPKATYEFMAQMRFKLLCYTILLFHLQELHYGTATIIIPRSEVTDHLKPSIKVYIRVRKAVLQSLWKTALTFLFPLKIIIIIARLKPCFSWYHDRQNSCLMFFSWALNSALCSTVNVLKKHTHFPQVEWWFPENLSSPYCSKCSMADKWPR